MEGAPASPTGPRWAHLAYTLSWLAMGVLLLGASAPQLLAHPQPRALVGFGLLTVVGTAVAVRFPLGVILGMQGPVTFAAVWLFGWPAAPVLYAASAVLLPIVHRVSWQRAAVFFGNTSTAMFLAGTLLWHYWGGPLPAEVRLRDLLAVLLAGLLHGAINTPSAAVARLFEGRNSELLQPKAVVGMLGMSVAVYSPISAMLALAYRAGVPVFALTSSIWLLVGLTLQAYFRTRELQLQLEKATRELEHLATTDPLTELGNRRSFLEVAQRELARHRRYGDPVSLVLLDLRHFKRVNDTLGHQAGDQVLRWVAHVLRRRTRRTDFAFRLGGDEFALLLPGTGLSGAVALAESLYHALHSYQGLLGADATLGVATCPEHGSTVDELVRAADRAVYQARQEGTWLGIPPPHSTSPTG